MSSQKQSKWFKSAFSQEVPRDDMDETPSKISKLRHSLTAPAEAISLLDDDEDEFFSLSLNVNEEASNSQSKAVSTKSDKQIQLLTSSSDWLKTFAPESIDDLAIHPKKISEVQDWLNHYERTRHKKLGQMLLITGPTGCGKTETVKAISQQMNYEICEWINPIDVETSNECNLTTCNSVENCTHRESQIAIFRRFLFRSSRYKSIFDNCDRRLILIEDFPNVFIRNSAEFHAILSDYCIFGKSPLIFIVTDSKSRSLNISHNLFTDEIKMQLNISEISFNAVAATMMKKALKRITTKLKELPKNNLLKIPSDDMIENIILTAQGDIRNAILNLHLVSLKGVPEIQKETSVKSSTVSKKRGKKSTKLTSIGRDENLTTFHALGRVLYPKYNSETSPKSLIYSPEDISDNFGSEANNFVNLIHSNYLARFNDIENVVNAIDNLSVADCLMNEYRNLSNLNSGLNVAVRGVMISNENPSGGWAPIKGVYKLNKKNTINSIQESYRLRTFINSNVFSTDYRTYFKIIKNT